MRAAPEARRRVVVTGLGAVTPLGPDVASTWRNLLRGESRAGPITLFPAERLPTTFAYEARDIPRCAELVPRGFEEFLDRAADLALPALREALADAGLARDTTNPWRTGVSLGVGVGSPPLAWYRDVYFAESPAAGMPTVDPRRYQPPTLTSLVACIVGARAGNCTVQTACSSSAQALGEAYDWIAGGDADVVVSGGADSMISPLQMAGFVLLGALSRRNDAPQRASRPFDDDRDGFVLGEGAAILVLEDLEHARRRGARVYAELRGVGITESGYRITDLHPEGRGIVEAMAAALADAGVDPSEVGYINAHGTSTLQNDVVEASAIARLFPPDVVVGSTKSMTGHTISAAGAIEALIAIKAVAERTIPPSVNLESPDPRCAVRLAPSRPSPLDRRFVVSNAFGFGGSNVSLVMGDAR